MNGIEFKIRNFLKRVGHAFGVGEDYNKLKNQIVYTLKAHDLYKSTIHSSEMGVSTEKYCDEEIVVSLTTYGKRLSQVYRTIESIMQGTLKPNHIVLWIDEDTEYIPITLRKQEIRGLEIRRCKDIRSFKKLIPSLKTYPDASIITIDDDLIYNEDFVENLVREHKKEPKVICANRVHKIVLGQDGKPVSYMDWKWCSSELGKSNLNFFTGVGGVLYPPHSLNDEVFNQDVFLDICKYADDVWFFAMGLLNGTEIKKVPTNDPQYLLNEDVQDVALSVSNTDFQNCGNDVQIRKVFEKYNIYSKLK